MDPVSITARKFPRGCYFATAHISLTLGLRDAVVCVALDTLEAGDALDGLVVPLKDLAS